MFHKVVIFCISTTEPFQDAPFIPTHETTICYQLTCLPVEYSRQVILDYSTTFVVPVPISNSK